MLFHDLEAETADQLLQNILRQHALLKHVGDAGHLRDPLLQLIDHFIRRTRHQLQQKSACALHAPVPVHEHAQSDRTWNLLGFRKVERQVLRDLSARHLNGPDIRLLQADIPDDREGSSSDCPGDIQLAIRLQRNLHMRIIHIPLRMIMRVRRDGDAAGRSVSPDLQGDEGLVLLQHAADHDAPCQEPSQCRCADRSRVMRAPCVLRHLPGSGRESADRIVRCGCPDEIVLHVCLLHGCVC